MPETTTETKPVQDFRLRLPALVEYRERAAKRRAAAFVEGDDEVMGQTVRPLTPATYSLLMAHGSHFLCGGIATEGDVRNYLWFHSPIYADNRTPDWQWRKKRTLRRATFEFQQPWRKWIGQKPCPHRYQATLNIAVANIRGLVEEAFADAAPASGKPGAPLATLEAQLVHEFATAYNWPPEKTRQTPLRQLFQLHRCIRAARGEDVKDDGEQRILAMHLLRRLSEMQAQRGEVARG
jgi:hypothetical protein